jgi:hypothetical protein
MEKRPSDVCRRARGDWFSVPRFCSLQIVSALIFLAAAGCASPGEPVERKPPIPSTISDLAADQAGNDVVLTCTVPKETFDHNPLAASPAINIYRAIHPAAGAPPGSSSQPTLLVTIPPAMVGTYTTGDHFRYVDSLTAGDFLANHQQSVASYVIRTSASPKKESADSNRVDLNIYPAPQLIADLQTRATQSGIALTWAPPQTDLIGDAPQIAGYHIYRANAETPQTAIAAAATNSAANGGASSADANPYGISPGASSQPPATPKLTSPLVQIAETASTEYRDGDAQKDRTYIYSVRSTVRTAGKLLESADSNLAALTLHDTFPPSAPAELIATAVPAEDQLGAHIDISWAINPETDLAGYNVYRSEQAGTRGTRINPQLLPTPAFRDMNAMLGRSYFYTATAVDRTGNESAASPAVEAGLPAAGASAGSQASP